ncbi:MAG: MMPL family transporter, partial [Polyangiaceae bacterium]|nr:MMPL family transporter [Polyangiaceae bacterium]
MNRLLRWLLGLAQAQERHPWRFVAAALISSLLAIPSLLDLGLRNDWLALLPEDEPSARDLAQVRDRVQGLETLTIVVESEDLSAMQRFASDLAPQLEAFPKSLVQSVDWNISRYGEFVEKHRHLYADLTLLEDARDALDARLNYERIHANPLYVDLEGEPPPAPEEIIDRLRSNEERRASAERRYPGGFFVSPNRGFLAIYVRTDISGGEVDRVDALTAAVNRAVESLGPASYARDLRVELAGSVMIAREEHVAVVRELAIATGATVTFVLVSILLFFRRLRSVALLWGGIVPPVVVTFGLATPIVGFLNASTAFLVAIVVGNGINPSIIWLARYFEERRRGASVGSAL